MDAASATLPPLPDTPVLPPSTKKARKKPRQLSLIPAAKVADIRVTIAASIFSEMKTKLQGMSKLGQSDMMFKKYHGFNHPGHGTADRVALLEYDNIESYLANVEDVPAYVQFLNGANQYKDCWIVGTSAGGSNLHLEPELFNHKSQTIIANYNITKRQLATKDAKSGILVTGRALLDAAEGVIKQCKKILSLIHEHGRRYRRNWRKQQCIY